MCKLVTNNVPRDLIDGFSLTEAEREEFDYLDWESIDAGTDSATFFRYKGDLYDLGWFTWVGGRGWDGGYADSAFSATLVRLVNDNEQVVVGRQYS